jgi:hypothetical protein
VPSDLFAALFVEPSDRAIEEEAIVHVHRDFDLVPYPLRNTPSDLRRPSAKSKTGLRSSNQARDAKPH